MANRASDRQKDLQKLMKNAQKFPGVATVMEVYGSHIELVTEEKNLQELIHKQPASINATGGNN